MSTPHRLYTLVRERPAREVRHLLIDVDSATTIRLIQLCADVVTDIAEGKHYEMIQKAETLAGEWTARDGFRVQAESQPTFEPLKDTVALALLLGHSVVFDEKFKNDRNSTGAVHLAEWPGMTPKNGGGYEYSLIGLTIAARPTLPHTHGLKTPQKPQENAAYMKAVTALLESVGPACHFLLG